LHVALQHNRSPIDSGYCQASAIQVDAAKSIRRSPDSAIVLAASAVCFKRLFAGNVGEQISKI